MGDEEALQDFPENDQRYAVCNSMWEESKMSAFSKFRAAFAEKTYSDYPDSVRNNARRGIELNKELGNKCATQVGKVRGQQLANKEPISVDTSFLLWGGKTGLDWAESKLKGLGLI